MELKTNSRLVQWAYFLRDGDPPNTTTLCRFFWRAFVFVPIYWLVMATALGCSVALLVIMVWANLHVIMWGGVVLTAFFSLVYGGYILLCAQLGKVPPTSIENSTFVQGAKTIKSKFCPIIYLVEDEE